MSKAEPLKPVHHRVIIMTMQDGEQMTFNNQRDVAQYLGVNADQVKYALDTDFMLDDDALFVYLRYGEQVDSRFAKTMHDGNVSSIPVEVSFECGAVQHFPNKATASRVLGVSTLFVNRSIESGEPHRGAIFRIAAE